MRLGIEFKSIRSSIGASGPSSGRMTLFTMIAVSQSAITSAMNTLRCEGVGAIALPLPCRCRIVKGVSTPGGQYELLRGDREVRRLRQRRRQRLLGPAPGVGCAVHLHHRDGGEMQPVPFSPKGADEVTAASVPADAVPPESEGHRRVEDGDR